MKLIFPRRCRSLRPSLLDRGSRLLQSHFDVEEEGGEGMWRNSYGPRTKQSRLVRPSESRVHPMERPFPSQAPSASLCSLALHFVFLVGGRHQQGGRRPGGEPRSQVLPDLRKGQLERGACLRGPGDLGRPVRAERQLQQRSGRGKGEAAVGFQDNNLGRRQVGQQ